MTMRQALPALLLLLAGPAAAAPPPADSPSKLVQAYFKAKKEDEKAKALAAIEAAPPLDPKDVKALRDEILKALAKAGRTVPPKGRSEWFDERTQKQKVKELKEKGVDERDAWKGLYFADGDSRKGLLVGFHGGGQGAGDAGSAQGAFSGVAGSLGLSALFPQVLVKTECGWIDPPETEQWVMEMVKRARVSWGVDPNRVYVTGHSMGGFGAWIFGSHYADAFAGGAAFAGAPRIYWRTGKQDVDAEDVVEGYLPNLRNLPFFVFQSLDDPRVKAPANVFACARLKEMHEKDPQGYEFVYEQVDGLGHGFPKKGPRPGLEWAASHVRNPRPSKIAWQPTRPWKDTFYWVRWKDPWINSVLVATADRARNAVDITLERPRAADAVRTEKEREERTQRISVYLDDRVLDLSREIVILVDGKERYRGRPEPRLATLLRSCEEREDPEYGFAFEARAEPAVTR